LRFLHLTVPWVSAMIQKSYTHLKAAKEDFELLNDAASRGQRRRWQKQLDEAMDNRIDDVAAMDILNVSLDKREIFLRVRL
jgi:hypothetical protein